jgi:hypothetical protein
MTEIKKTLSILKARWPEATLIVGLYTLAVLSNNLRRAARPDLTRAVSSLCLLFSLTLMVLSMILNYGFLRTVYLEGEKRQTPMALLKKGRYFFWRMVGFGLIYVVPYFILAWLIFLIIKYFTSIDTDFFETAKVAPWLYQFCFIAPRLILIKVVLFIPALIFVLDCRVFKSFKFLKLCKLWEAKELLVLFFISMGLTLLWALLPKLNGIETPLEYIFTVVLSVSGHFIGLMIAVMAVRFVASLNLEYDR